MWSNLYFGASVADLHGLLNNEGSQVDLDKGKELDCPISVWFWGSKTTVVRRRAQPIMLSRLHTWHSSFAPLVKYAIAISLD